MNKSIILLVSLGCLAGCAAELDSPADDAAGDITTDTANTWQVKTEYPLPSESMSAIWAAPYTYPYQECVPVTDDMNIPAESITVDADGKDTLCVWQHAQGCVPEGYAFEDFASCEPAMTTSASFFKFPGYKFESDKKLLEDEEYQKESNWVRDQIRACGCVCCHDAEAGPEKGFATAFDVGAPGVWTDTMTNFGLLTATGDVDTTLLGGTFDPAENHGYNRAIAMFPSNDRARMTAFFKREIARRGLTPEQTQEEIDSQEFRFAGIYKNYFEETLPCEPGAGIAPDGTIHWNPDKLARYVYVLKADGGNVGDPPGLDKPEGVIWRMDTHRDAQPHASGDIRYGIASEGSFTRVPKDDAPAPELEVGTTYKLIVLRDFGPYRIENCHFVMGDEL